MKKKSVCVCVCVCMQWRTQNFFKGGVFQLDFLKKKSLVNLPDIFDQPL